MKKVFGFTLAEVLITLGIIGVVAALTIPSLQANINSAKYKTQFKKSLSTWNQAIKMAQAKYDFDTSTIVSGYGCSQKSLATPRQGWGKVFNDMCGFANSTLTGHRILLNQTAYLYKLQLTSFTSSGNLFGSGGVASVIILADGSSLSYGFGEYGIIDVNGLNPPNKEVLCNDNTAKITTEVGNCVVGNKEIGDIFPIWIHDNTIEPATNAGRAVLQDKK